MTASASKEGSAYRGIMKSAALLGSARVITMLVGLIQIKFLAFMLGPAGVGLFGTFEAIVTIAIYISSLGVSASGVREIAMANASNDPVLTARKVHLLRRITWILGLAGMISLAALALPISRLTFSDAGQTTAILILSPTILITSLFCAVRAVIQGMQRIADLAKVTVISAVMQASVTMVLVYFFGANAIAPSILVSALCSLFAMEWAARKLRFQHPPINWRETLRESGPFVRLGIGLTYALLVSAVVAYAIRALIVRDLGLEALGIYLCAFALSGKFIGFILEAMQTDFFPRLSAAAGDNHSLNRLVNQQTEIVLLMAVPGLLATLAFAPWLVRILYSAAFDDATVLLRWFILGCLGRVIWAPMGYVALAKGRGLLFFGTEALMGLINLALIVTLLGRYGLQGAAFAYLASNFCQVCVLMVVTRKLTGFSWSPPVVRMVAAFALVMGGGVAVTLSLGNLPSALVVGFAALLIALYCLRQLLVRLGTEHPRLNFLRAIPLVDRLLFPAKQ